MQEQKFKKTNYYTSTSKKVVDFCIGFFVFIFFNALSPLGLLLISNFIDETIVLLYLISIPLINIMVIIFAFKLKRKFIGIGIITELILSFILFLLLILFIGDMSHLTVFDGSL